MLTDSRISGHFLSTLVWNLAFAIALGAHHLRARRGLALALNSDRMRGQRFYRILLVLPYAMPSFAMLLVWSDMFNQDFGLINKLFGLDVDWLGNPWTARFAVILIQLWLGYPYMFLVVHRRAAGDPEGARRGGRRSTARLRGHGSGRSRCRCCWSRCRRC